VPQPCPGENEEEHKQAQKHLLRQRNPRSLQCEWEDAHAGDTTSGGTIKRLGWKTELSSIERGKTFALITLPIYAIVKDSN
jgi:hypothetical protein